MTDGTYYDVTLENGEVTQSQLDEVKELNQRLLNNTPKGTTNTNPAYINDSADLPLNKFVLEGKTEQDSTTGKQLANIDEALNNNLVKIDNKYKLNKNGDYRFSNDMNVNILAGDVVFQVNVIEWNVTGSNQNYLGLVLTYEDNTIQTVPIWSVYNLGIRTAKMTTTKKITKIRLYLDSNYDDNSNIVFNDFMVSYGTEAGTYEPYTGRNTKSFSNISTRNKKCRRKE